jgi:hypothetical protein
MELGMVVVAAFATIGVRVEDKTTTAAIQLFSILCFVFFLMVWPPISGFAYTFSGWGNAYMFSTNFSTLGMNIINRY